MRLPYLTDPTEVDIAPGRRAVGRRHDQPRRRPPRPARDPQHVELHAQGAPCQPASRPTSSAKSAISATRRSTRSTSWIRCSAIEALLRQGPCRRRGAAVGRRRPSDHAADPARHRQGSGRSAWSISTPIPTPATAISATTNTPTARRSAAPSRRALLDPKRMIQIGIRGSIYKRRRHGLGRRAAACASIYIEEFFDARRRQGDRRGAPRRRRRPDLCQLRRRRPRSGLCAGHRHAGDRRLHDARGAAHAARPARASTSSAATSSRSRRPSIPAATPRWSAPP